MKGLPEMTPVKSTHLGAIGYKGDRLFIRFGSGHVYSYPGVPEAIYRDGLTAESPGKWFHAHIKGKFKHQAVDV